MLDSFSMPANFVLMYSVYIVGTASPGPSNLSIMAVAMNQGRNSALALASGIITGSLTWGLLAGFGLATVLATWANALIVLKLLGGLYLLWLAYCAGRLVWSNSQASNKQFGSLAVSPQKLYFQGVAMHLTNPKAIVSWVATISVGLPGHPSIIDVLTALSGCLVLGIATFVGYALVFSTATAQRVYAISRRWFEGTLAAIYGYAGIRLLFAKA